MKTMQFTSHISEDGILRLQIPTDMPTQEVEIVVIVQPLTEKEDEPLERGSQSVKGKEEKIPGSENIGKLAHYIQV